MKIAIIGAGAAGLAALRHSLDQGHNCVVFEQTGKIGGTWNYTDSTDVDENGLPVHSSMYQGLRTNLPKELMEYEDFPYEEKGKSYIYQEDVLEYINKFATHFNLRQYIKFFRHTLEVDPSPVRKWKLKEQNLKTKEVTEHTFDAVIICVGNYSVPNIANIAGSDNFSGKSIHSHYYRKADPYKNKRVLIIGAGPSGVDISRLVREVAEKVYISYRSTTFSKISDGVIHKPLVKCFEKDKVIFEDGSKAKIDNVIYCTGYRYSYPFLTQNCGIKVENNWVKYLYKHVVNVEHPTMCFIGVVFKICPFPAFEIQVKFFLQLLKGKVTITKQEMMADILNHVNEMKENKVPLRHVHKIGLKQGAYFDDLANTAKIKKVRSIIQKLYVHIFSNRNLEARYKIINDEEFVEVTD